MWIHKRGGAYSPAGSANGKIDLDEVGIKEKIKAEVERVKKFQRVILGTKEKIEVKDIDIRNYAKYVLREASDLEKRELLGCLRSRVGLQNKIIKLIPKGHKV